MSLTRKVEYDLGCDGHILILKRPLGLGKSIPFLLLMYIQLI